MNRISARINRLLYGRYDYSTHVFAFHERKAIYMAVPKVANTSIKTVLGELFPVDLQQLSQDKRGIKSIYSRHRDILIQRKVRLYKHQVRSCRDYFVFAFVRNPWDRLVSCFRDKLEWGAILEGGVHHAAKRGIKLGSEVDSDIGFDEFVQRVAAIPDRHANRHFRSQYTFIADRRLNLIPSYVGRFESLSDDFAFVMEQIGAPESARLPHLRSSKNRDYRDYYTERLRGIVEERYQCDIHLLDYSF